jgi:diguanylate cyclase (GGDEF)-like protein
MVQVHGTVGRTRLERLVSVAVVLLVGAFLVSTVPGVRAHAGFNFAVDGVVENAAYLGACLLAFLRVRRSVGSRWGWLLLAVGLLSYEVGSLYWEWRIMGLDPQPFPSGADALWLSFYPLAYGSLFLLLRARLRTLGLSAWLDGVICGLGAATVTSAFVIGPVLAAVGGSFAAVAVNLAYPVLDVLLILFVVASVALTGWRPTLGMLMLITGFLLFSVCDAAYLVQVAHGTYVVGHGVDVGWIVGFVLMAAATGRQLVPPAAAAVDAPSGTALVVPVGWVFVCLSMDALSGWLHLPGPVIALAYATSTVGVVRMVLAFREVRSLAHSRVEARTDALTGLANRRALYERLETLLHPAPGTVGCLALLILDLDRFKEVNDSLGHHLGDELLAQVGPRLQSTLRDGDVLARLGGDEFAVVLPGVDVVAAEAAAGRLLAALQAPFHLVRMGLHIDASIGVAVSPQHAVESNGLLQRADIALYQAKEARGSFATYDSQGCDPSRERLQMLEDLRAAIDGDDIVLHYQPKVHLPGGEVRGVEALVRWWHPEHGLCYPDLFLPLVEQAGLMHALTDRVLNVALDQVLAWQEEGLPFLRVAVNLSASSVVDAALPARVVAALAARSLPGSVLSLEVTEQFLMADRLRAREVLVELRSHGIAISIDDFGTGYSSLAYLRDLPIDELKLDGRLSRRSPTTPALPAWSAAPSSCATRWGCGWSRKGSRTRPRGTNWSPTDATRSRAITWPARCRPYSSRTGCSSAATTRCPTGPRWRPGDRGSRSARRLPVAAGSRSGAATRPGQGLVPGFVVRSGGTRG